jgi:hypothetical protein
MKTEFALGQLRHLYSLMLAGNVTDTAEAARGLLGPAIARLESGALTPPKPEDVARWHDKAQYAFKKTWEDGTEATSESFITEHAESLDALRDGAARVPGLEARIAELETESGAVACDGSSNGGEMCGACVGCVGLMRSERDASRKEAESLRRQVADLATLEPVVSDAIRALALPTSILPVQLPEAVRLLQQHAASQNERVATLEGERDERLTLQAAQRDSALRDVASLRERVATLEDLAADRGREALEAIAAFDKEKARAEAAERRVAEYDAAARDLDAHLDLRTLWKAGDLGVEDPGGINGVFAKFRALLGMTGETYEREDAPTPAPAGLLEAVGQRVAEWRLGLSIGADDGVVTIDLPRRVARAILAAYDAAKGGERVIHESEVRSVLAGHRFTSGSVQADAVNEVLVSIARDLHIANDDTPPSGPGGGETKPEDACGDCGQHVDEHRDGGKAESCEARNDLCEPSTLTPESLAAVSDLVWKARVAAGHLQALHHGAKAFKALSEADDVLRRALSGQVPEVLSKARVVEVLTQRFTEAQKNHQQAQDMGLPGRRHHAGARDMVQAITQDLNLTLPTPDTATHHGGPQVQARERRPEPVPEVPALKPMPAGAEHGVMLVRPAQPEPSASEVVWEHASGFRVMPYGKGLVVECQMEDGSWAELDPETPKAAVLAAQVLAHALAEAKRENARLRAEMDVPPGFRIWDRSNDALQREARKGAEDMRERAAKAGGGACFDQRSAALVREAIHALPLE